MNEQLEKLDLVSDISQLISLYLLLKDTSNDDLMRELQRQNELYFERIINLLEEIKERIDNGCGVTGLSERETIVSFKPRQEP